MTIQFYGSPMSSSGRSHLALEEIGRPYEYHRVNLRDAAAKAEYLKVNPQGRVPFIIDDGFALSESVAINFYLVEKYKPEWLGKDAAERTRALEWTMWGVTNLQPEAVIVMFAAMGRIGDPDRIETAKQRCAQFMTDAENQLAHGGAFLLGDAFTIADINAGAVVSFAARVGLPTGGPRTTAYLETLRARPAWARIAATP